jgi:MFS family permease
MSIPQHHRLAACFFLFSLITGAMYSRLPDIQLALGVNEAQLGLTLIGAAIGSLISLTFSSPLIERLGARATGFITVLGSTACYASITLVTNAIVAFAILFVAGLLAGALEINLNVQIGRLEALHKRSLMSRAHGFWSLGFFVTSLLAAGIRQAGVPAPLHLAGVFAIVLVIGIVALSGLEEAPVPPTHDTEKPPLVAFPTMALVPLCLIGCVAFLIEGAGVDWSTIYMRDVFHAEPFVGGLALTLFTAIMAAARIFLGPVIDRFSPRTVVAVLLGISIVGLGFVWLAPHAYVAIIGFGMLGGGCSAVYPLVVSAAAQRTDRPSSVNVAAIGQISFVVFFLAPPILGFIAHTIGIRWSYLICLPLVIASLFAIRALPARGKPAVPGDILPEPLSPNG